MGDVVYLSNQQVTDSLRNFHANLGTERDKASHSHYTFRAYNPKELLTMYRGSWLPRKIVDVPAFDSVRRWRTWNASAEVARAISAEERRLQLPQKVLAWEIADRLFGGAVMYIATGSNRPSEPLNPMEVARRGIRSVNVMTSRHITPGPIDRDIESPYFDQPAHWTITGSHEFGSQNVQVHPSRLVIGTGNPLPAGHTEDNGGWHDSILNAVMSAVLQADSTVANVASLVFEAKTDVIHIPDLMNNISDAEYERSLLQRFQLAATQKGNNGMLILDAEETYNQKKMSFSTLPEVMDRFYQNVSGAADIPMTRLYGMSPGGMNATGDSDLENYYNRIQMMQTLKLDPQMSVLNEVLVRSALGYTPRNVRHQWESLWEPSEAERSEIMERKANTLGTLVDKGVISNKAAEKLAVSEMSEHRDIAGIAEAVDEFPVDEVSASDQQGATISGQPGQPAQVGDATARSLYVYRSVVNAEDIVNWAKDQGFENVVRPEDLHVTITYSRDPVDWMKMGTSVETLEIGRGGPRMVERFGADYQVLLVSNYELMWRHYDMRENGASYDHPEYQPHITFARTNLMPENVEPYKGPIVLGPEFFEEVDE